MRGVGQAVIAAAALALVGAATVSRTTGILCNTAIVMVLSVLMIRARRTDRRLRLTRTWMLAALLSGVAAGIGAAVDAALRPHATYPRVGDVLEILYIPCTLVALLHVPLKGVRRGYRARALSDGLVAVSSLLFLLEPLLANVAGQHHDWPATIVGLAIPLGGVAIVSAALTTMARCADEARPMLLWLSLGITLMASADLVYALNPNAVPGPRRALLQVGLTLLLGAASSRSGRVRVTVDEVPRALSGLPFLPFAASVGLSSSFVLRGKGLDATQLILAVLVGMALVLRQAVGARDKARLVGELEEREASLQQELRSDRLTGVANRLGLEEALYQALQQPDHHFGLVIIDLDDFKLINDNHGHAAGDQVLRQVAHRLVGCVRSGDVVARMGGDEFAVLLHGPAGVLASVSDRLVQALAVPVVVDDRHFRLSASIGLVGKEDGDTVGQLLADADGAMYEAKTDRGASSLVRLDREGRQSVAWRSQVREQIAHPVLDQFEVHYQPVVDLRTGELRGFEALLRWNHPTSGRVPPDVFIPLAEQSGSIAVLGDFVLTTALRDLALLSSITPERHLVVGVNISPRQLVSHDFAAHVADVLAQHGVEPEQLVVEITEQAFEADVDSMQQTVRELIAGGVAVAVDDFGTGYSSLRYLQSLDLALLKIDRTFVSGIGVEGRQERLLDGITALAHRMSLEIVAEGIETPEQLAMLRTFGCELGQGYLFCPPLPVSDLVTLVTSHHRYDVQGVSASVPLPRAELFQEEPTA